MTTEKSSAETTASEPGLNAKSILSPDKRVLIIERIFDAPREIVFKAWTDPKQMTRWWGPKGFTNPVCEMDLRPGGAILIHMAGPDGKIYPMTGVFVEIVEPERLVMRKQAQEDAEGNSLLKSITTVTFAEHGGKTKLTLHEVITKAGPGAESSLAGMEEGWNQSLDRLSELLATR